MAEDMSCSSQASEWRRRRILLVLGALALGSSALVSAVSMWGSAGVGAWIVAVVVIGGSAVASSRRTERMYQARSVEVGKPVFAALLNGVVGGDVALTTAGVRFDARRRVRTAECAWTEAAAIRVRRKGPLGSAGLVEVERRHDDQTIRFEVADVFRFVAEVENIPSAVAILDWMPGD
jgi:hypothetical protein